MSNFLGVLLTDSSVVKNSELHNDGLFVAEKYITDTKLFAEVPLLCLQTIPNRQTVLACGNCHQFVGSVGLQLAFLTKKVSRSDCHKRFNDINHFRKLSDVIPCSSHCGEIYCTESCRYDHFSSGHKILCTGRVSDEEAESHPLILFKKHAVETNEIFLLVADVFARICLTVEENSSSRGQQLAVTEALHPYESYVRNLWWDVAIAPEGDSQEELGAVLQSLVQESWVFLNEVLQLSKRGLQDILSVEYMARTIGMFEQNNVGVRLSSPIEALIENLQSDSKDIQSLLALTEEIVACIDEDGCWEEDCQEGEKVEDVEEEQVTESETGGEEETKGDSDVPQTDLEVLREIVLQEGLATLFPPLDGTAFYTKICKMNHSCDPNVIIKYTSTSAADHTDTSSGVMISRGITAEVIALRPITEGEELLQSYIDQSLGYEERQAALKDYGFTCRCRKCLSEASQCC